MAVQTRREDRTWLWSRIHTCRIIAHCCFLVVLCSLDLLSREQTLPLYPITSLTPFVVFQTLRAIPSLTVLPQGYSHPLCLNHPLRAAWWSGATFPSRRDRRGHESP